MTLKPPVIFWTAISAVAVLIVLLLREILLPFVAAMVLAYALHPLADRLERLGLNRLVATLVIFGLFSIGAGALVVLMAPLLVREFAIFIEKFPRYVRELQALAADPGRPWLRKLVGEGLGYAEQSIRELTALGASWLSAVLRSVWSGGQALISFFSVAVITPIVACYLLCDWPKMIAALDGLIPPARRDAVRALACEVDDVIGGFVRGQSAICAVLSLFYVLTLTLIGLKHGVLIGLAAGLISFVPYVGALTGLVVSMCVAIAQSWPSWTLIALVVTVFFTGQLLADYVLSPYFVGRRINVHPVWLIFALFTLGYLFGFLGLLIAVPLAGVTGVLMRFALRQYLTSPLYTGNPNVDPNSTEDASRPSGAQTR